MKKIFPFLLLITSASLQAYPFQSEMKVSKVTSDDGVSKQYLVEIQIEKEQEEGDDLPFVLIANPKILCKENQPFGMAIETDDSQNSCDIKGEIANDEANLKISIKENGKNVYEHYHFSLIEQS